ncbi:MAG: hypothetical protein GYB68_01000 [Chloroflexi bacterium]|nr:hypothetical protein [Chloroflexota bacterium]
MEEIADGITLHWFDNDNIAHFMIGRVDGNRADTLSEAVLNMLYDWPLDMEIKLMFDLSISGASMQFVVLSGDIFNVGVTDDGKHHFDQFLADFPDRRVYLAVILPMSVSGRRAERTGINEHQVREQLEGATFFDREDALRWLRGF